ncbi:MAG: hypothetical protein ILP19_06780 [Oscillospiraceae bacterium]|nr:hypothetical protein [Oscillospiraceae bacterium]
MITTDRIIDIQKDAAALFDRYKDIYSTVMDEKYNDAEAIWCRGWRGPYEPDFADEMIMGNIYSAREALHNKPRKKEYVSAFYFRDGRPVRAHLIGKAGEIIADRIYMCEENRTVGIAFCRNWDVFGLTEEVRDEKGRPVSYMVYERDRAGGEIYNERTKKLLTIRYSEYSYDDSDRIVKAVYLNGVTPDTNDLRKGWLLNSTEGNLSDLYFTYTDDGATYTRDDYNEQLEMIQYENDPGWKFPAWLLRRYQKLGIGYFG